MRALGVLPFEKVALSSVPFFQGNQDSNLHLTVQDLMQLSRVGNYTSGVRHELADDFESIMNLSLSLVAGESEPCM